jgi:hypothetical protein
VRTIAARLRARKGKTMASERRARVQTSEGYMIVIVVGSYRGQWRVRRSLEGPVCRPSGAPLGSGTMLVPPYALNFVPKRKRMSVASPK